MERETTQRAYWQKAFSVSECRKTACGLVDTDPQGALYSPEKLSTPCIHSPSPKQNKQPFHAARGLRTTTSISCKLLLASSPSRAACQENSGSFITQMQTLKSNGRKWACPQSVFSACHSRLRWRLWAFQVNGSYWSQVSTRIALQFWVPHFRLSTALISKYGKGPKFNKKPLLPIAYSLVLKVKSLDQEHPHPLVTCRKFRFSGPAPNPLNQMLWGTARTLCFNKSSPWFWCSLRFKAIWLTAWAVKQIRLQGRTV